MVGSKVGVSLTKEEVQDTNHEHFPHKALQVRETSSFLQVLSVAIFVQVLYACLNQNSAVESLQGSSQVLQVTGQWLFTFSSSHLLVFLPTHVQFFLRLSFVLNLYVLSKQKTDGNELGTEDGTTDGVDDGSVLIDGILDGDTLGAGDTLGTCDGHIPHENLQVWKKPVILQFSSFAIAQVVYNSSTINSA